MELKSFAEGKRDARHSKHRSPKTTSVRSNNDVAEAIARARAGGLDVSVSQVREDGAVRMKLVVRKQELKQMLEAIRGGRKKIAHQTVTSRQPLSGEQRLHLLWRRKFTKDGRRRPSWQPALQSIPEELQLSIENLDTLTYLERCGAAMICLSKQKQKQMRVSCE